MEIEKSENRIIESTELLNKFNEVIGTNKSTLDSVITASSLLLASALRQLGGQHGLDRARLIGAKLEDLIKDDNKELSRFFHGK